MLCINHLWKFMAKLLGIDLMRIRLKQNGGRGVE
jgi:hypothetical protein